MKLFDNQLNKKIFQINVMIFLFLFVFLLLFVPLMLQKISSPYPPLESLYWLFKQFGGMSDRNFSNVENLSSPLFLETEKESDLVVAFIGDFMPINQKEIIFSHEVRDYLKNSDFIIGDFEGIITKKVREPSIWDFDMRYDRDILNVFRKISNPRKIYLSIANNHAFDFGKKELDQSNKWLKSVGLKVFGKTTSPYIDIDETVRIVGATKWLNKKEQGVLSLEEAKNFVNPGGFNILYSHLGYEFELYPRKKTIQEVKQLLEDFDAVISHHPHCPQPVSLMNVNQQKKLVVYSLGTFLGEVYERKYQYGLVVKLFFGKKQAGTRALLKVEYKVVKCQELLNEKFLVNFSNDPIGAFNQK